MIVQFKGYEKSSVSPLSGKPGQSVKQNMAIVSEVRSNPDMSVDYVAISSNSSLSTVQSHLHIIRLYKRASKNEPPGIILILHSLIIFKCNSPTG